MPLMHWPGEHVAFYAKFCVSTCLQCQFTDALCTDK